MKMIHESGGVALCRCLDKNEAIIELMEIDNSQNDVEIVNKIMHVNVKF